LLISADPAFHVIKAGSGGTRRLINRTGATMRLILAMALSLICTASATAKIRTLPVSDLVATAQLIVIAEVASITADPARSSGAPIRNELKVARVLKGTYDVSEPLVLGTYYKPGQKAREDGLVFPAEGRRVLLFLKSAAGGRPVTVNGIQGLWPLEAHTDKTLGMGFRYSIKEIENLIAAQKK
jgi:hypothetical protein